jgi:transcriptional regulator with XRE-family HTH domain
MSENQDHPLDSNAPSTPPTSEEPVVVSPPLSKRRLSRLLREAREAAGLIADDVADAAHDRGAQRWSASKITRLERDEWLRPKVEDVELLLDIYGVTAADHRAECLRLAREARQKGWWAVYPDVVGRGTLTGLEPGASRIRAVGVGLIPGLLQTQDYAKSVIIGGGITDPEEIARRLEVRMLRQRVLFQEQPPTYWAIIDETALRKCASVTQLQHLIDVQRPDLRVQILPDSVGPHAAITGGFTMLDFEEDTGLVYAETATSHQVDSEPEQIDAWDLVYQYVSASALSLQASDAFLRETIDRMR